MTLQHIHGSELRGMIAAAVSAPSSHNTQPWRFVLGDDQILVYPDQTRRLPINDPNDRELTISCGAAAFTLRLAVQHAGRRTIVERLPDPEDPNLLYRITITPEDAVPGTERLYRAIDERHTTRTSFTEQQLPSRFVDAITEAAADHGVLLDVMNDPQRMPLAELIADGDRAQFSDPKWRRELASWMRRPRSGDGLAAPPLIAPIARTMVAHLDVGRRTARGDHRLATTAPLLVVLSTDNDRIEDWLVVGEALQHMLLVAAAKGIQAGFLNQPCQVPELRHRLAELCQRAGHPQVVLRLGHPAKPLNAAPRRPLDAVIQPTRT